MQALSASALVIMLLLSIPAWTQGESEIQMTSSSCWKQEKAPGTRRTYSSEQEYFKDLDELQASEPEFPGLLTLFLAYRVYTQEEDYANQLRDKIAHCYVGCVLTLEVGDEAAYYAAWYKEHKDLTDCRRSSLFEWADIDATVDGIEGAGDLDQNAVKRPQCEALCLK